METFDEDDKNLQHADMLENEYQLAGVSWELEEELEKENIRIEWKSNDEEDTAVVVMLSRYSTLGIVNEKNTVLSCDICGNTLVLNNRETSEDGNIPRCCQACSKHFCTFYKCNMCPKEFTQKHLFDEHIKKGHRSAKILSCDICNNTFVSNYRETNEVGNRPRCCQTCTKHFCTFYKCNMCSKEFTQKNLFDAHMKEVHNDIKEYKCNVCCREFAHKGHLKSHMKVHIDTGVKEHKCIKCLKEFTQKSDLNKRMKLHTGVKEYKCTVCLKEFTQKGNLDKHMKVHTGIKEYNCDVCFKQFNRKGNLDRHMKVHKDLKDHKCYVCCKEFAHKHNLNSHMKIHSGVREHKCKVCFKEFIHKHNLNAHMKVHRDLS